MTAGWELIEERGTAAELHGDRLPVPDRRLVRVASVVAPAVVLGSTQRDETVDLGRAVELGLQVARRRSGGGAVLVRPGHQVWLDVALPRSDPLWDDDVGRAARWLGEVLATALRSLGVDGARAHGGPFEPSRWSPLVCFAGRAPGEVVVGDRKVAGTSQRRSRTGVLFQVALALVWAPETLLDVLRLPDEAAPAVASCGIGLLELAPGLGWREVVEAVADVLPR